MKILIIVKSKHNDNTMKLAEAMSEVAPATVIDIDYAKFYKLSDYDIVGFGSGIYFGRHAKELFELIKASHTKNKYCFVFSTSGSKNYEKNNRALIKLLKNKEKTVLGSFGCQGLDKFFIFRLFGGINKGKPNADNFDAAQSFINNIMTEYENLKNN